MFSSRSLLVLVQSWSMHPLDPYLPAPLSLLEDLWVRVDFTRCGKNGCIATTCVPRSPSLTRGPRSARSDSPGLLAPDRVQDMSGAAGEPGTLRAGRRAWVAAGWSSLPLGKASAVRAWANSLQAGYEDLDGSKPMSVRPCSTLPIWASSAYVAVSSITAPPASRATPSRVPHGFESIDRPATWSQTVYR